jgi:hypothetical protein
MPDPPDDEKTLAVPSPALLGDLPKLDLGDDDDGERTRKFEFDVHDVDGVIGDIEDAGPSIPVSVAGVTPRMPSTAEVEQAAPTTRPDREFTPSGERASEAASRQVDAREKETVAPGSGRRRGSAVRPDPAKGEAVTFPVAPGADPPLAARPSPDRARAPAAAEPGQRPNQAGTAPLAASAPAAVVAPAAPAPGWFAGYLATCLVLLVMGLVVLWFEHKTLGHLLP